MIGRRLAAGGATLLALAGCAAGTGGDDASTTGAFSVGAGTPTPTATDGTPAPPPTPLATGAAAESDDQDLAFLDADAESVADPSGDARLTVTGVRVGAHADFDRVVFDLAGAGTPGWFVNQPATAAEDATGTSVPLSGDGILQVLLRGMGYPADTGFDEWRGDPITTEGYAQLWEVHFVGTFEGQTQAFVGTKDDDPAYRVFTLADPLRVVVDVRH